MASYNAVANREESKPFDIDFTFEWEIQNFAMLAAHRLIGHLDSPIFRIGFLKDSTWYLRLLTNYISNPICMLYGSEIFSGKFEFRAYIEILPRIHAPEFSFIQYQDRVVVDSQSPCVLFKDFRLFVNRADYQMPPDWPQSMIVRCTVWELPYVGLPDPRFRNLPEQPLSYDWEDLSFISSPDGEKDVRTCRPYVSRGYTQVDIFEKTVTWTIERFLTREPECKRSLYLKSGFGDPCPLIITLYVSGESGTKGDLIVELRRDCHRVIEFLLVRCQIFAEGRSGDELIFPSTTHILDSWYPRVLHPDFNIGTRRTMYINGMEYGDTIFSENGGLTLRFEIELTLKNAEHLTQSTFFLWERPALDPVQDFKQAMQKVFDKQKDETLFDVQLKSRDGRIFNCHKIVLAARSSVFADRFQTGDTNLIFIDDVHSDTLKRLLDFVYAAVLERLDVDELLELYSAAFAYKVPSLMGACVNRIVWMLTKNNIEEIKKVAYQYEDRSLAIEVEREFSFLSTFVDN